MNKQQPMDELTELRFKLSELAQVSAGRSLHCRASELLKDNQKRKDLQQKHVAMTGRIFRFEEDPEWESYQKALSTIK